MLFKDMSETKRLKWLKWARTHDWGVNAYLGSDSIHGLFDSEEQRYMAFTSPDSLKAWAGY